MNYIDIVKAQLRVDEGVRRLPYKDTVGKLTIGVGRNLDDRGLRDDEIDLMLVNDIQEAEDTARVLVPNFNNLSDARKAVVVNMAFNLGQTRLAGFSKMLTAINEGRYEDASREMLDSMWASQVGARAPRLSEQMRNG